jgi:hypothetical protein
MSLDLQRIVHYGTKDGTIAEAPQRRVITVTDAVVAGEGDGPLSPVPVPFGIMTFGADVAALEWVHAMLMGLDPDRIPLVSQAFAASRWPLTGLCPSGIRVCVEGDVLHDPRDVSRFGRAFSAPAGWRGWCEAAAAGGERAA